jgi:hypothetical protein
MSEKLEDKSLSESFFELFSSPNEEEMKENEKEKL